MTDLTGQIGLVPHPHTFVEWAIDKVTRSTVHHAVLAITPAWCISCEPHGARLRPISHFPDAYWSEFDLTGRQRAQITCWGREHLGAKYGWFADAVIGVALLTGIHTPKWIEKRLNRGRRFECAQFCAAAYDAADMGLFERPPAMVYPGLFVRAFRDRGWLPADAR